MRSRKPSSGYKHGKLGRRMRDVAIPDLTFPMMEYGRRETRWDLRVLLYRGAGKTNLRVVFNQIAAGEFGRPLVERLELVKRIHAAMTARLVGGGSRETAFGHLRTLREFFRWADDFEHLVSLETVEDAYRHWADYLLNRVRLKSIKNSSAYNHALIVSSILGQALERNQPLIRTARLHKKKRGTRAVGVAADKQSLAETFAFGHLCLDIIDSLPLEAVYGPLPVTIQLRDGRTLEMWSKLQKPTNVSSLQTGYKNPAI